MNRAPIFEAFREFMGGRLTPTEVAAMDEFLDRYGPRDTASNLQKPQIAQAAGARKPGKKSLVALIGATAATILTATVMQWEGRELTAYKDVVGIWTICDGDTANVTPGQVATEAECNARLERQLIAHAEPVLACTPGLKDRPHQLAAAASLAYNIGPTAYCRSTVDRRFDAGDFRGGCDAFLMWNKAGGREIKGLTNRRRAERQICLRGT